MIKNLLKMFLARDAGIVALQTSFRDINYYMRTIEKCEAV